MNEAVTGEVRWVWIFNGVGYVTPYTTQHDQWERDRSYDVFREMLTSERLIDIDIDIAKAVYLGGRWIEL